MSYEIFRAGTRTDANGNTVTITHADLAAAAQAYDPKVHEAPIVVGHPKADAPAYGWVSGLKAENGVLTADFDQVDEDFADLVKAGRYKQSVGEFLPSDQPEQSQTGRLDVAPCRLINTYAYREMLTRKALNEAYRQQHPRFATGLMLDLCGDDVNTPRLEASASRCTIRFTLAASHSEPVVIPQSTQIAAGATVFQTASEGTLSPAGRTLDFINSRKRVRQTFKRPFPSLSCIIIQIMRINRLVSGCSVRSVREMPSEKRYGRCISDNAVHRVNSSGLSVLILPNAVHWS